MFDQDLYMHTYILTFEKDLTIIELDARVYCLYVCLRALGSGFFPRPGCEICREANSYV